jgi:hypothetical protein
LIVGAIISILTELQLLIYVDCFKTGLRTPFNLGTSFNGKVYCSYYSQTGKILLGVHLLALMGGCKPIRLNNDGSIDASFNTQIAASSGIVYSLALQSNGSIIVAGSFTKYNGVTANRVVRLSSGTVDTDFVIGLGASGVVEVQIQPMAKSFFQDLLTF